MQSELNSFGHGVLSWSPWSLVGELDLACFALGASHWGLEVEGVCSLNTNSVDTKVSSESWLANCLESLSACVGLDGPVIAG